ncbi:MAG TPA: OsmC family protein [Burkholderiaceae bacterium]|jgi:organic hydroperoxide reductase OsmC/OhrA|nr:OsmC family protein [Burkholderiaceae bacterium]
MHTYEATVSWHRDEAQFVDNRYSRAHEWAFDGGLRIPASSSPLSVPLPMSVAANVDPEEALVAATSSCHMLFFLSIAARHGFVIDSYIDRAIAVMEKNGEGKIAITRITLRPQIVFSGEHRPAPAELDTMHHEAHERCYIANSLKSEVAVEPA